ncbi:HNH endonuclease, partial [Sulfurovum sp. bin170]|uniref:HNH endonuclease n=1 Tax=Sulfurovum sp. bin170 TaxID=2695268 RepID=UPI001CB75226
RKFNLNISGIFGMLEVDESDNVKDLLNNKKKLLRKNIPSWAKKAVFFRDRGTCTYCKKDLSGIINISNNYHIDHIVPLAKYGFNDISNEYEKWY